MNNSQKTVLTGAISGVVAMALSVYALTTMVLGEPHLGAYVYRFAYALQWDVLALLPLMAGYVVVGNARFLSDAINPLDQKESPAMIVDARVLDNTLQQTVIFIPATLAAVTLLPPHYLQLIPAVVIVFLVARILFWVGYRIHPLYRAFGMAATGYLNLGLLAYCIYSTFF